MEGHNFADQLERNATVVSHVCTVTNEFSLKQGDIQFRRRKQVDGATLAKRWGIDPAKAASTAKVTTQRGVRTCLRPNMSRIYPTNDRMLRYNCLPQPVFF